MSAPEFTKYNKIENAYQTRYTQKMLSEIPNLENHEFVVQEKLDGANFSFWVRGDELYTAKRTGFIREGEKFFGHREVVDRHREFVHSVYYAISDILGLTGDQNDAWVVIYGELIGPAIQRRIGYEEKQFVAFDIALKSPDSSYYLTYDQFIQMYDAAVNHGIGEPFQTVPVLKIGKFNECFEYSPEFDTSIPTFDDRKQSEGVVIKPRYRTVDGAGRRVVLKNKADAFSEHKKPAKVKKSPNKLSDDEQAVFERVVAYINENRVYSVVSKIGTVTEKDFGKILGLTIQDAMEDYVTDNQNHPKDEVGDNWKKVQKKIQTQATPIVRSVFVQVLSTDN